MDVPLGPVEAPYDDRGEGWRMVIVDEERHVRIAELDGPKATDPAPRAHGAWRSLFRGVGCPHRVVQAHPSARPRGSGGAEPGTPAAWSTTPRAAVNPASMSHRLDSAPDHAAQPHSVVRF